MNKQYEYEQNLRGSPDNFFEKWLFWHGMTHLGSEEKKAKGVKKSVIEKKITFDDYKRCLFSEEPQTRTMNVIRSYKHEVYTEEVNKVALDSQDDKSHS